MIEELQRVRCARCDKHLKFEDVEALPDAKQERIRVAGVLHDGSVVFNGHSQAILAAELTGWSMQSETIGGDTCVECLNKTQR